MVKHKERINERKVIYFCWMAVCKWKININEDPSFWSNGHALKKYIINERGPYNLVEWSCANKKINQCGPLFLVEWSCTKERLNERGPYIFVEWSCAYRRNKSVGALISGRMVILIRLKCWSTGGASHHPAFMGDCPTISRTLQLHGMVAAGWCTRNWLRFDQTI